MPVNEMKEGTEKKSIHTSSKFFLKWTVPLIEQSRINFAQFNCVFMEEPDWLAK